MKAEPHCLVNKDVSQPLNRQSVSIYQLFTHIVIIPRKIMGHIICARFYLYLCERLIWNFIVESGCHKLIFFLRVHIFKWFILWTCSIVWQCAHFICLTCEFFAKNYGSVFIPLLTETDKTVIVANNRKNFFLYIKNCTVFFKCLSNFQNLFS